MTEDLKIKTRKINKKIKNLKGMIFGDWTVVRRSGYLKCNSNSSLSMWLCQCVCGVRKKIPISNLTTGKSKRCTTCSHEILAVSRRVGNIWESCFRKRLERVAIAKGYEVSITAEQFKNIAEKDCYYCGSAPEKLYRYKGIKNGPSHQIMVNGIDRKDSDVGYTLANCLPCCSTCNFMKNKMPFTSFIEKIKMIHNNLDLQSQSELDDRIFKKETK
jgi:hypothetical protein